MEPWDSLVTSALNLTLGGGAFYIGASLTLYLVKRWNELEPKPKQPQVNIPLVLKEQEAMPLELKREAMEAAAPEIRPAPPLVTPPVSPQPEPELSPLESLAPPAPSAPLPQLTLEPAPEPVAELPVSEPAELAPEPIVEPPEPEPVALPEPSLPPVLESVTEPEPEPTAAELPDEPPAQTEALTEPEPDETDEKPEPGNA